MAGIEEVIINDQYLVVIAISLLFTVLAIVRRGQGGNPLLLDVLSMVFWFITGAMHLLASPTTTPFYVLSILWWGVGMIFLVLIFVDVFSFFSTKRENSGVGAV